MGALGRAVQIVACGAGPGQPYQVQRAVAGEQEGIAYSYKGARAGRPHVATWAEAGVVTAADLLAGDEDPRPGRVR